MPPPPLSFGDLRSLVDVLRVRPLNCDLYVLLTLGLRSNPWGLDHQGLVYLAQYLSRGKTYQDHLTMWALALEDHNALFPTPFWFEGAQDSYDWKKAHGTPCYPAHTTPEQDQQLRTLLVPPMPLLKYGKTPMKAVKGERYHYTYLFLLQGELRHNLGSGYGGSLKPEEELFLEELEARLQEGPEGWGSEDSLMTVIRYMDMGSRHRELSAYWKGMAPCFEAGAHLALGTWDHLQAILLS
jgi:hypothetical protein